MRALEPRRRRAVPGASPPRWADAERREEKAEAPDNIPPLLFRRTRALPKAAGAKAPSDQDAPQCGSKLEVQSPLFGGARSYREIVAAPAKIGAWKKAERRGKVLKSTR
ncbi:hypothetical protein MTO96_018323 [Rhipicephalus appendiculatus]